jgi:hypothetical protein
MKKLEAYGATIVPYVVQQIIYIDLSIYGVTCLWASHDFITNIAFQLFYHNGMLSSKNVHYELVTFLEQYPMGTRPKHVACSNQHTWNLSSNQKHYPLSNEVKKNLYLRMASSMLCTHKSKKIKSHSTWVEVLVSTKLNMPQTHPLNWP